MSLFFLLGAFFANLIFQFLGVTILSKVVLLQTINLKASKILWILKYLERINQTIKLAKSW